MPIQFNTPDASEPTWVIRKDDQIDSRFLGDVNGVWFYKDEEVGIYRSRSQNMRGSIVGYDLKKVLESERKLVLGVRMLDYYCYDPASIPVKWLSQHIFFWGTISYKSGDLWVQYLHVGAKSNLRGYRCLKEMWSCDSPAAIYVPPAGSGKGVVRV